MTVTGRAVLAPASGNSKDGCAVLERLRRTVAPEFATREGMVGYLVRYFEYLCLVTGLRVDSEIIADGDDPLHDLHELNPRPFGKRASDRTDCCVMEAVAQPLAGRRPGAMRLCPPPPRPPG